MRYKIALYNSEEGYSVSVPGLPGCWSQGKTKDEAIANIETAITVNISRSSAISGTDHPQKQRGHPLRFWQRENRHWELAHALVKRYDRLCFESRGVKFYAPFG